MMTSDTFKRKDDGLKLIFTTKKRQTRLTNSLETPSGRGVCEGCRKKDDCHLTEEGIYVQSCSELIPEPNEEELKAIYEGDE